MSILKKSMIAPSLAFILIGSLQAEELESVTVIGNQESYYDEYSTTSMKGEFKSTETPYTTNVTNKTLIKDLQALRVEDIYDYTTGVTATNPGANGIIVRGFEPSLENLNVNGMPGLVSRFSSPSTSNIEKIEIVKGPASVLYGAMEAGSYINIQTKQPEAENKVTFSTSYSTYVSDIAKAGDDNSFTTSLDATGTIKDGLYYRFIAVGESIETFRDNVGNKNYYIYPSLLWEPNDESSLTIALEYANEDADADEGLAVLNNNISTAPKIDTVYQENGDFDNDDGKAIDIKYEYNFSDESILNLALRSVFHTDERNLYENRSVNDSNKTVLRRHRHQYNERDWHTLDANYQFKVNTKNIVHNLTTGASYAYRKTDFDRKSYGKNLTGIDIYNPVHGENSIADAGNRRETIYKSAAIYLQDKIDLTDDLILVAAIRGDRTKIDFDCIRGENGSCVDNSVDSNNFVGSLGAVYSINPFISVYTSMGQSYEPFTAERVDAKGNGLDAEESEQVEVGAKFNINEQFNTTISAYKIKKKNIASKVSGNVYELIGEVESKGYEIDVQWLPTKNWQVKAGYAYNDAKNITNSDNLVSHNPKNTVFAFTRYNFPTKVLDGILGISSGISYKSSVYTDTDKDDAVKLPSYTKADLGIHYDKKDWGISLNIENITDKEYYQYGDSDYGIYAGEPRKITLSFQKTF